MFRAYLTLAFFGLALPAVAMESATLQRYAVVQTALAEDKLDEAKKVATELAKDVKAKELHQSARELAATTTLADARAKFGTLSEIVVRKLSASGDLRADWTLYRCPMVKGYGQWVQAKKEASIRNPYMGTAMQGCGVTRPWEAAK